MHKVCNWSSSELSPCQEACTVKTAYSFPLENFMSREKFERIKEFAKDKETPCLIIDLEVIRKNYENLQTYLPWSIIYYAVKANPDDAVVALLRDLGSNFDVASRYELDQLLRLGVSPDRMSFGNTIKKEKDIAYFYEKGVRLFVTDSISDIDKLSRAAPGSKVFFRLLTEGLGADWPLSKKFGSHPDLARQLMKTAVRFGLEPYGISFHPGSQQRDVGQWSSALAIVSQLFNWARHDLKIDLKMINMGGGFPANYLEPTDSLQQYAEDIKRFLDNSFGLVWPEKIVIEPGRSMAGDAGVIVSEIINIAKKSVHERYPWVFLDIGKFGGLIETLEESIKYPIYFEGQGSVEEVILAGPTCDSMDILYERTPYFMPSSAQIGDKVYILTAGAYTQSYSSVYFNGFPPLKSYILPSV
ncbi:Ornithine decarboxylase [uncultured spirochete]|uniref:ornithine decarboxylase n=1 Tax=uncultured spirochete TaxID=156406 RepID=A0A3P3XUX6_9SPIR|nr:Ornithine decarboxylase [uncultured spirochete]